MTDKATALVQFLDSNDVNQGNTVRMDADIEIGAVEIKDGTTDQRAIVDSDGRLRVVLTSWGMAANAVASGAYSLGAIASGAVASGAVAAGAMVAGSQVDGHSATLGTTIDAAASSTVAEDTTARTQAALLKGLKNIAILQNAKFVSGTDIGDVDVTSIVPGVAATNLGKAEDAVHASGDVGVMALAVRQDVVAALGADGDYVPLSVDDKGRLYIAMTSWGMAASSIMSGAFSSGAIASGAVASGAIASGAVASGAVVDGAIVTLGAKTDAASTATDATSISQMQVLKQVSKSAQAVNTKLATGTVIGNVNIGVGDQAIQMDDTDKLAVSLYGKSSAAGDKELLVDASGHPQVDVLSITAGETHVGQVGGEGLRISQTPTVTAGAYSANDAVGGLLTFAGAARVSTGSGVIKDVVIIDDNGQDAIMELWLFSQTFTAMGDNAAWAPSEADLRNLVAVISTGDGAWRAAGTPSVNNIEVARAYNLAGTSLFGQLVTRGTPTFAATDDVTCIIQCLQD